MKKLFFYLVFVVSMTGVNKLAAQTGIAINSDGSVADGSAMLDVKATDKGILIPRVTLTSAVTIPVNGLLVYQTGGTPGFYYHNGTAWIFIQNSGNANVTLQGNTFNGASQLVQLDASTQLPAISGVNVTSLNAANLASGTVPTARLGSGTANSITFLRGDNTWSTPAGGSIPAFFVHDASTASTFDCTSSIVSNWIFDANGRNLNGVTINVDLPGASGVPAGTIIRLNFAAHITASPTVAIRSAGSVYNSFGQNDTNISASYLGVGIAPFVSFLSDGSTKWYRVQ